MYYLHGDGTHEDTQSNYETALQQWAVKKEQADHQHEQMGVAESVKRAFDLIGQRTEDFRKSTDESFETLGRPNIPPSRCDHNASRQIIQDIHG